MTIRLIAICIAFLSCAKLTAQTIVNKVINSGGTSVMASGVLLESNVGETFAGTHANGSYLLLTHGFLQPLHPNGTTEISPTFPSFAVSKIPYGIDNAGESQLHGSILLESTLGEWMTTTRTGNNCMITQGILQPYPSIVALPVTGLAFYAKRISQQQVQLDWKTLQEVNNKGFRIERKTGNEANFSAVRFINSKALNGNSSLPLNYMQTDTNTFSGQTYYRLKQEDLNGAFVYSVIRVVNGEADKTVVLKAWPLPAKDFFVSASGIVKDVLLVFDASGRWVKQFAITDGEVVSVNGLAPGTYFLKLKEQKDVVQKVLVQ